MAKYQIRFVDKQGHGSFCYVDCEKDDAGKMAAEKATEYINRIKNTRLPFQVIEKPKRVVDVWEWDTEKKEVKKKGHRFKLQLMYVQATYNSGRKVRNEWYEPIEK